MVLLCEAYFLGSSKGFLRNIVFHNEGLKEHEEDQKMWNRNSWPLVLVRIFKRITFFVPFVARYLSALSSMHDNCRGSKTLRDT